MALLFLLIVGSRCFGSPSLNPSNPAAAVLSAAESTYEDQLQRLQHYRKRLQHTIAAAALERSSPVRGNRATSAMTSSSSTPTATPPASPKLESRASLAPTDAPPPSLQQHKHRAPRSSFSLNAARPPTLQQQRARDSYLASASGSQTSGADAGSSSEDSPDEDENEGDWSVVSTKGRSLGEGLLGDLGRGSIGRRRKPSPSPFAGEGGRGNQVLVERRSSSAQGDGSGKRGLGGWGSSLLQAREGSVGAKRRPSSPALNLRSARPSPRGRGSTRTPEPAPRTPSPPLTLDSIQSTYNPFPLFHIRIHQIPEVTLLVLPVLFGLYRLYSISPTPADPSVPSLPYATIALFALCVPFIALFRRDSHYFMAPFTDERGYRDPTAADDGVTAALMLPLLLSFACYWDVHIGSADGTGRGFGLEGIAPLVAVWESQGIKAVSTMSASSSDPKTLLSPLANAHALLTARYQLVLLTALNAAILILHLVFARTVLRIEKLPTGNTKRFFGFMAVANAISLTVYATFSAWDYLREGACQLSFLSRALS